jgi:hypothetical protein
MSTVGEHTLIYCLQNMVNLLIVESSEFGNARKVRFSDLIKLAEDSSINTAVFDDLVRSDFQISKGENG